MKAAVALRLPTAHPLVAFLLVLVAFHVAEEPWPLTVQAARRPTEKRAHEPGTYPRDYYLGEYGARCVGNVTGAVTPDDAAERLACFSGRGVRVALLDTGLCAGITERSRNSVTCTSVVPGVACEDAGCAHGTRSVSVLAGQLSVSPPLDREPPEETAWRHSGRHIVSAGQYIGLAPGATVRVFRVFDRQGRTHQRYLARALGVLLREAEDSEAGRLNRTWDTPSAHIRRRDETVDVINLSYGSEDYYSNSQVQSKLYRLMHEHGVVVVAASGNDGVRFGSVRSPADMPGVLAVGALRVEGHGRTAQTSRTLDTNAQGNPAAGALGDLADSFAAGGGHKSVAHFSGRGPTTWELPFGAGRVKPDLVALGQHVWTVQGVSAAAFSTAAPRRRRAAPALQLRSVSGTSIAAPIVAGVVALCLEAAWSSASAAVSMKNITGDGAYLDVRHNRLARVSDSLLVREAILRTAIPLEDTAASLPSWPYSAPVTPSHNDSSSTTSAKHPRRRVLAGVPLLQLYARYLHLSRVSILSQGAGEVQPLRALHAIVARSLASSASNEPDALRSCTSFAIPPSVRMGCGISSSSRSRSSIPQSCQASHDPDGKAHGGAPLQGLAGTSLAAYWWPFSDQLVYPGATPVLLNLSLHLCPSSSPESTDHGAHVAATAAASGRAARLESRARYTHVTYVLTKVSGYVRTREGPPSEHRSYDHGARPLLLFLQDAQSHHRVRHTSFTRIPNSTAWNASHRASSSTEGIVEGTEATVMGPRHTRADVRSSAKRRSAQQRWLQHLLRVETELTPVAHRSPTRPSVGKQQPQPLSPPPTSFSLSVAISSPSSASTRLCYDVARETVTMWRKKSEKSPDTEKGTTAGRSSADGDDSHDKQHTRDGTQIPEDHGSCVPLFHLFRALDVEGALHIFTGGSASQLTLAVPFTVRVVEPPPRVQRVLIDTSLDWFNPTTASSSLFIAGDDPHESAAGGVGAARRRGQHRQSHERAYAEAAGGDHPYTNLVLLWLYLRHTLGMAVETFPLLHTSTMTTPIAAGSSSAFSSSATRAFKDSHIAQRALADALAHVGTLIIIDPERPLTRDMRRLLTHAVLGGGANHSADGLNVLLVTDWYSTDMAAQLYWTRNESLGEAERSSRRSDTDAAEEATGVGGDRDTVRSMRAYRQLKNGTTRGLAGTSHVPSWNRWLWEVMVASGSTAHSSGCNHATNVSSKELFDGPPELPFELSETIVIDGVLVVNAAAPTWESGPETNATATYDGGTATLAKAVAVRSLGQLKAAGVLQWRLPTQPSGQQLAGGVAGTGALKGLHETSPQPGVNDTCRTSYVVNIPAVPSTQEGEAVICNVMPSWAQQQRRLVKRTILSTGNGSVPASAQSGSAAGGGATVVEDDWEELSGTYRERGQGHIGRLAAVEIGTSPPASTDAGKDTQRLTHGVLGFLTPPPPSTRVATVSTSRFRPGRIAIFTDSDCLSASDYNVQTALDELEVILYPPSASSSSPAAVCATWDCFARSPDGQRLLQAESTQSSVCVEVVKELLLWTHTGNLHHWRDSAQLQCEERTWARAVHRPSADTTIPSTATALEVEAGLDSVDGGRETTSFDELLETAPERAHVGEAVWRLWAALVKNTAHDASPLDVCDTEDGAHFQRDYASDQASAAAEVIRTLMMNYHGDWHVHLLDNNVVSPATGATGNLYLQPPRIPSSQRRGLAAMQLPAECTPLIESLLSLGDLLNALRWLQHPIVLGQLMVGAAVLLSVWLWRALEVVVRGRGDGEANVQGCPLLSSSTATRRS
ncbi:subtilisin-like serine peptidase [Leishmania panamensis]|uniref:Subtilisin-like serine peptidase n=1 Tax=Leishmania panamensis TaxID=5679 RepID=A0A088RKG9_LEIPA|nr:subtilisin-like serine peptidase [Leishmania panamensis]AIN96522.1 subtilisin-like serine peptidase [Leishmania panamensis]